MASLFFPLTTLGKEKICQWKSSNQQASPFDFVYKKEQLPSLLNGKQIGEITIVRYMVFDENNPKETIFLYQWLNSIHYVTTENVVNEDLLFTTSDKLDLERLSETERKLRSNTFIFDARVRPVRLCNDTVDLEVTTRDTWSISPSLNLSRSGGENKSKLSITESNFLGTGKLISVSQSKNSQRTEYTMRFEDHNIGGSRRETVIEISDNSDGYRQFFTLNLPFYSLASTKSYSLTFNNEKLSQPIYHDGEKILDVNHKNQYVELFYGKSDGYINGKTNRWRYGITYNQDKLTIDKSYDNFRDQGIERKQLYPWLELSSLKNKFTTIENYRSIKRTEDINLGRSFNAKIGYSDRSWSNDHSRIIFELNSKNALKRKNHLFTVESSLNGFWRTDTKKTENLALRFASDYYNFSLKDWVFFTGLTVNHLKNPHIENQLFLGGDTGLRGYPIRHRASESNAILTIEQRFYSNLHLFQLMKVGAVAYIDIGKTWGNTLGPMRYSVEQDNRMLANVGFGLRFAPTRAYARHVIHVDIAFPIGSKDSDVSSMQFLLSAKRRF
ncbi:MAG: BamA/TamA family outer membrane protein [Psychrobium sp.]|nr:BamA/TamA family outer membrane protein [Psychrobium sp.]